MAYSKIRSVNNPICRGRRWSCCIGMDIKESPEQGDKGTNWDDDVWYGSYLYTWYGKWKYTKKFWNKTVEPYFVDLLDNVIAHGLAEFIRGLRSDN